MARKKIITRPAMTRPVTLRRGIVAGEVRIYQELIRLAAEQTRVIHEQRMWAEKRQGIERQLQAIGQYREDLFKRLKVYHQDQAGPGEQKGSQAGESSQRGEREGSSGHGGQGVMDLHYCSSTPSA